MAEPEQNPALETTPEWRRAARTVLDGRKRGARSDLAEKLGITPGGLTQILSGETKSSEFVVAISEDLGIEPPPQMTSELHRRLMSAASRAPVDMVRNVVELLEHAAKGRDG